MYLLRSINGILNSAPFDLIDIRVRSYHQGVHIVKRTCVGVASVLLEPYQNTDLNRAGRRVLGNILVASMMMMLGDKLQIRRSLQGVAFQT